ncbi:MAG: FKBP-type peptidyl-prolyl cis-trans isomerase [Lachnospiraceae bacterium]|nr:FKBP-type peptidyl-prolyl cis-trans isomerase [Lachnospiraceae bacterium]
MRTTVKKVLTGLLTAGLAIGIVAGCGKKEDATRVLDLDNIEKYVEVPGYESMEVSVTQSASYSDDELEYYAKSQYSQLVGSVSEDKFVKNRAVKDGDMINLDYSGYKDGVQFDGGTATNQTLWIGSNSFIDGFEEGLIGVNPGETVDLDLTFPENYNNTDLAGAAVVFTCTVNAIIPEEAIIEVWNSQSGRESVEGYEGLKAYIADYLDQQAAAQYEGDISDAIVDKLLETAQFKDEFPASLILKYQEIAQNELETNASYYGYDNDGYANAAFGMTADQYIKDSSYERLQMDAAMFYIAEKEGIVLSEEDSIERLKALLISYGYNDYEEALTTLGIDPKEYRVYFMEEDVIAYLKSIITIK